MDYRPKSKFVWQYCALWCLFFHEPPSNVSSRQVKIDIGNNYSFWQFVNFGLFLLDSAPPPIEVNNPDGEYEPDTLLKKGLG